MPKFIMLLRLWFSWSAFADIISQSINIIVNLRSLGLRLELPLLPWLLMKTFLSGKYAPLWGLACVHVWFCFFWNHIIMWVVSEGSFSTWMNQLVNHLVFVEHLLEITHLDAMGNWGEGERYIVSFALILLTSRGDRKQTCIKRWMIAQGKRWYLPHKW